MSGLRFDFADIKHEIRALETIAKDFIAPRSGNVLSTLRRTLEQIQDKERGQTRWQIHEKDPLRTVTSVGEWAPPPKIGAIRVFADLSFVWEISPERKKNKASTFLLDGLASTTITLWEEVEDSDPTMLARWKIDVGVPSSPGTHFHIQLNGDTEERPYPKSLDIPRLPALVITPMLAFESVVAELFQDRWKKEASRQSAPIQDWNRIHRERLVKLFEWQRDELVKRSGTPWTILKLLKPDVGLFTGG
jgi:hypothetical protein